MTELARARQTAAAATPGPWSLVSDKRPHVICAPSVVDIEVDEADWGREVGNEFCVVAASDPRAWSYSDTRYVATFDPPTVLAMLDALEAVQEYLDAPRRSPNGSGLGRAKMRERLARVRELPGGDG